MKQRLNKRKQVSKIDPNCSGNVPIRFILKDPYDDPQNSDLPTGLPLDDGSQRKMCFAITDLDHCQLAARRRRPLACPTRTPKEEPRREDRWKATDESERGSDEEGERKKRFLESNRKFCKSGDVEYAQSEYRGGEHRTRK